MKRILKNTWAILDRAERKKFIILAVLDLVISILDIFSLILLLWIVQFYIGSVHTGLSFLPSWIADKDSMYFITIFFVLFGVKNLAGFLIAKAQNRFMGAVALRISGNNLRYYQLSGFEEFIHVDSSVHLRKICFQPFEYCQYILSGFQQFMTQSCLVLLSITAIIFFSAKLFLLLLLILLPPVILVFQAVKKRLSDFRLHIRSTNEKSLQYVFDALKGYVEGNVYGRNDFFLRRFLDFRARFSRYLFDSISLQTMPSRIIELFAVLGLLILIAIAKWSGGGSQNTLILVGAFMAAAYKIIPGMVKLINVSGQIRAYELSAKELLEPVKKESADTGHLSPDISPCSIQFKNIFFEYPGLPVIDHFDLTIRKGDFIGITGRSGRGKTTLFNLLLGFLSPGAGEIFINEVPVGQEGIRECWPFISYVRQQPFFIHDTLLRNITLEEEGYDPERLSVALRISGVDVLMKQFPEELQKVITENGRNISGGQQQRIMLARALYKPAELYLLDEPFNELDEAACVSLLEHFRELGRSGKMILMITHDRESLSYCNKIISLDEN